MSTDGICHTLPMAKHDLEHYASANTESVTNDLPKASRSQTILKFRPPKEAWITGSGLYLIWRELGMGFFRPEWRSHEGGKKNFPVSHERHIPVSP